MGMGIKKWGHFLLLMRGRRKNNILIAITRLMSRLLWQQREIMGIITLEISLTTPGKSEMQGQPALLLIRKYRQTLRKSMRKKLILKITVIIKTLMIVQGKWLKVFQQCHWKRGLITLTTIALWSLNPSSYPLIVTASNLFSNFKTKILIYLLN